MRKKIKPCPRLRGEAILAGDKSISHRAVILNSIAQGKATISNSAPGADFLSTVACLRALGVEIKEFPSVPMSLEIQGGGGLKEAENVLDTGNSGTTMRLLAGLLVAV
jgi:3-phosphoshikimate 1-carboxyvinyltransferase